MRSSQLTIAFKVTVPGAKIVKAIPFRSDFGTRL